MQFDEMGNKSGKTLMLLPGTACDYQANFATVSDFVREYTLASGGPYCDCGYKKKRG